MYYDLDIDIYYGDDDRVLTIEGKDYLNVLNAIIL